MPARPSSSFSRPSRRVLAGAAALLTAGGLAAAPAAQAQSLDGRLGRYIVTLDDSVTDPAAVGSSQVNRLGGSLDRVFSHALIGYSATLPQALVGQLLANPLVKAVEPDGVMTLGATQTNPPSYGIDRVDQRDLPLSKSYTSISQGSGVRAYVIDTGINPTHPDFTGRIAAGVNTVDGGTNTTDCNQHGTHVSGTVGGTIYGVAKLVTFVPVKVFGCSSSTSTSAIIAGIDWAKADHQAGQPAVANLSLGGSANTALDTAITNLSNDGVAIAVAAGNDSADACSGSPSRVPQLLTVAASDQNDAMASFSNGGTCVDLFAPGVNIVSAAYNSNGSNTLSGTSMSSPHVAGALALELAAHPGESAQTAQSNVVASTTVGRISGTARKCTLFILCRPATPANKLLFVDD